MVEAKKERVKERQKIVEDTCRSLLRDNIKITPKNVGQFSKIPHRTLERDPYKKIIKRFKETNNVESPCAEVKELKEEIKYLREVLKKMNEENKNLIKLLYKNGVV